MTHSATNKMEINLHKWGSVGNLPNSFFVSLSMDVGNLWIGDLLCVIDSGMVGTFEGMHENLVMIKVGEKIHYFAPLELVVAPEVHPEEQVEVVADNKGSKTSKVFSNTIDLHLEELPDFEKSKWPHPVDYQAYKCRLFVEEAITQGVAGITIIHGIGAGILKAAVLEVLDQYPQIKRWSTIQNGGATLVEL